MDDSRELSRPRLVQESGAFASLQRSGEGTGMARRDEPFECCSIDDPPMPGSEHATLYGSRWGFTASEGRRILAAFRARERADEQPAEPWVERTLREIRAASSA